MAQPYTVSFGRVEATTPGATLLFTVPAVDTWELREIVLYNGAAAAGIVQVLLSGGGPNIYLFSNTAFALQTAVRIEYRTVLPPGAGLYVNTGVAPVSAIATGYHLSAA